MKLTVMKLVCLLALLGGIFILGLIFNVNEARMAYDQVMSLWPKEADGTLNLRLPGGIAAALLVLLGGYGFLPRLRSRKEKVITYRGAHGDIALQLKPIRKVLLKVMRKMPEVYSIKLAVKPDKDGRRASILADVVLKNSAALGARRCAKMVTDCLTATAKDVLGLEELSAVRVNIKGVHLNVGATGRQMREQVVLRAEEEESAAYALAHPPVASVTLDEHSTDNRPLVLAETQDAAVADAVEEPALEPAAGIEEDADSTRNSGTAAAAEPVCEACTDELTADEAAPLLEKLEEAEPAGVDETEVEIILPPLLDKEEEAAAPVQDEVNVQEIPQAEDIPDAAPVEPEAQPETPAEEEKNTGRRWW